MRYFPHGIAIGNAVITANTALPVDQCEAGAVLDRPSDRPELERILIQHVERRHIAGEKQPSVAVVAELLRIVGKSLRRIPGRIDGERNQPDGSVRLVLQAVHVRTHSRTRPLTIGENEVRYPDVSGQSGTGKGPAEVVGQLENRDIAKNRKRSLRAPGQYQTKNTKKGAHHEEGRSRTIKP